MAKNPFGGTPFDGQDGRSRRARSVIPEVPLRRKLDGGAPPTGEPAGPRQAAVVFGGLALIFAITLLVENILERREIANLEPRLLEMAAFSGEPLDRPETRLEQIKDEVEAIRADFGVEVHYLYARSRYFPMGLRVRSGKAAQLPIDELERVLPFVRAFLSSYPAHLIRENLSDIYLASQLSFSGRDYGGTYIRSSIYVSSASDKYQYDDLFVLGALHHEFSSILMYRYDFPFEAWQAVNKDRFVYPENALDMLESKDGNEIDEALLEGGFLRRYATSDMENDINVMAEWLFTKPDELRALGARFDRIGRKARIAKDFYRSIDPRIAIR